MDQDRDWLCCMCVYCLALFSYDHIQNEFYGGCSIDYAIGDDLERVLICPICKRYHVRGGVIRGVVKNGQDYLSHHSQLGEHVSRDAAERIQEGEMVNFFRSLSYSLSRAKFFVFFTSWRIDPWFLGALSVASYLVRYGVHGVVTGIDPGSSYDIDKQVKAGQVTRRSNFMDVRVVTKEQFNLMGLGTHTKMINVDGSILFRGSGNMTLSSWYGAHREDAKSDALSISTDLLDIIGFHNEYFAPVWSKLEDTGNYRSPFLGHLSS